MTKQEFIEIYGTSVYKVRLSVASSLMTPADLGHRPKLALELADEFVELLLSEDLPEQKNA